MVGVLDSRRVVRVSLLDLVVCMVGRRFRRWGARSYIAGVVLFLANSLVLGKLFNGLSWSLTY